MKASPKVNIKKITEYKITSVLSNLSKITEESFVTFVYIDLLCEMCFLLAC